VLKVIKGLWSSNLPIKFVDERCSFLFLTRNKDKHKESIADNDDSRYRCSRALIHFFSSFRTRFGFTDDPQNLSRQTQSRGPRWNISLRYSYFSRIFLHSTTVNRRVATSICSTLTDFSRWRESVSAWRDTSLIANEIGYRQTKGRFTLPRRLTFLRLLLIFESRTRNHIFL